MRPLSLAVSLFLLAACKNQIQSHPATPTPSVTGLKVSDSSLRLSNGNSQFCALNIDSKLTRVHFNGAHNIITNLETMLQVKEFSVNGFSICEDVNSDGVDDIVNFYGSKSYISRNTGYEEKLFPLFENTQRFASYDAVASLDINNDGYLDFIFAPGDFDATGKSGSKWYVVSPVYIILNNKGQSFTLQKTDYSSVTRGLQCGDLDGDGDQDCFLASYGDTRTSRGFSRFLENKNGTLEDTSSSKGFSFPTVFKAWGTELYHNIASKLVDLNNDGRLDIAVVGQHTSVNTFIQKPDGTFLHEIVKGTEKRENMNLNVGDFNNDGFTDLYVSSEPSEGDHNDYFMMNTNGVLTELRVGLRGGTTTTVTDLNRDGTLEINLENQKTIEFKNQMNWLGIDLKGCPSGCSGVLFTVKTATKTLTKNASGVFGFYLKNDPIVHFGLGAEEIVTEVTMNNPATGIVQTVLKPKANRYLNLVEFK